MTTINKIFIFVSIMMLVTGCANNQFMLDRGIKSFKEQNYRQAFLRLEPVARAGNAYAQYALGYMYYNGQGVVEDKNKALQWMRLSASQGNQDAIRALNLIAKLPRSVYAPSSNPKKRPL
jgi:TPR repeat protein